MTRGFIEPRAELRRHRVREHAVPQASAWMRLEGTERRIGLPGPATIFAQCKVATDPPARSPLPLRVRRRLLRPTASGAPPKFRVNDAAARRRHRRASSFGRLVIADNPWRGLDAGGEQDGGVQRPEKNITPTVAATGTTVVWRPRPQTRRRITEHAGMRAQCERISCRDRARADDDPHGDRERGSRG